MDFSTEVYHTKRYALRGIVGSLLLFSVFIFLIISITNYFSLFSFRNIYVPGMFIAAFKIILFAFSLYFLFLLKDRLDDYFKRTPLIKLNDDRIIVRRLLSTKTINWSDIEKIELYEYNHTSLFNLSYKDYEHSKISKLILGASHLTLDKLELEKLMNNHLKTAK